MFGLEKSRYGGGFPSYKAKWADGDCSDWEGESWEQRGVGWERKMSTIVGFILKCRSRERADKIHCRTNRRKLPPSCFVRRRLVGCSVGPCGAAPLPAALGCWEMRGVQCWCALLPPLLCKTPAWILLGSQLQSLWRVLGARLRTF